jgi:diguanylate cyclase (GGDEF)-like protein/PAS domain S-box-containing protein
MTGPSNEEQLLEFLYACPIGLIECNAAGEIAMLNPHAMQHLLPLAGMRNSGNLFAALEKHAPELRNLARDFAQANGRICDGHRIFVDLGRKGINGNPKVIACTMVKLGPDRLMVTLTDVSDQVAQEVRLQQVDMWFSTMIDSVNDYALLRIENDGTIESANASFTVQTGRAASEVIGMPLGSVLGNEARWPSSIEEQIEGAIHGGWSLCEGWERRADGQRYWCQRLVVKRDTSGRVDEPGFCVVLRDVPARDAEAEDLHRLLTCDHLTGASNRMQFRRVLEREHGVWLKQKRPLSLIMFDLDHFKTVNDTYGHPAGDALLCAVVQIGNSLLPERSALARLGGEEFGILLPGLLLSDAVLFAEALRDALAKLVVTVPQGDISVTASFGCASIEEVDGSVDDLISLADQRLYFCKRNGRNRVWSAAA